MYTMPALLAIPVLTLKGVSVSIPHINTTIELSTQESALKHILMPVSHLAFNDLII